MAIALAEIKSVKQELKDNIGTVDTRVSKLSNEVNVLKNEIVNIREEQGTGSKNEVEKLKEQITKMHADRVKDKEEATREMTQREIRRVNIVAFNVPEGNSEYIDNRRQHDRESLKQICDDLRIDNIEVMSVTRQQNRDALPEGEIHPKPLRIRLKTEEMRSDVMRKAKMLAKSESATHRRIYLKRDMTPLQRAEVAKSRKNRLRREEREPRSGPRCPQQCLATSGEKYVNSTFAQNVNSTLACMYFNADSLLNKRDELKLLLDEHKPMVVGITEVTPKNYRTEIQQAELSMDGYQCLSNLQRAKRGVCIYTHESLGCIECRAMADEDIEESVWCEMKLTGNDKLLIGCIYRSPNSTIANYAKINELLRRASGLNFSHLLVFGDLNHPSINWLDNISPPDGNHPASLFMDSARDAFLTQHVTEPTHYRGNNTPNTLDLIFTNEEGVLEQLKYLAPVGSSHHSLLKFDFCCYSKTDRPRVNK